MENHGVISGKKKTDWIAGTIPWVNRNPSGNWHDFLVKGERQYFQGFDTMACVSFATNNVCEIQIKQQTGQEVNFSDRFLAKMSGTTNQGNWVYIVLDTWRKIGVVNEDEWPKPPEPTTFQAYYGDIPQFIIDRAKSQSTDLYDLQYEYINDHSPANIQKQLQHAPLLITIPGHEITGIVLSADNKQLTVLDDYEFNQDPANPFVRKINLADVTDIYKAVLTVKKGLRMEILKVTGEATLVVKNAAGKYWDIATDPANYPMVARMLGIAENSSYGSVTRAEVNANYGGQLKATLAWVEK